MFSFYQKKKPHKRKKLHDINIQQNTNSFLLAIIMSWINLIGCDTTTAQSSKDSIKNKWNSSTLLVGELIGTTTLQNCLATSILT